MILPLNLVGVILGRNMLGQPDNPCRVNTVPRPIPEKKWYALLTNRQCLVIVNMLYKFSLDFTPNIICSMLCSVQPILDLNKNLHSVSPSFFTLCMHLRKINNKTMSKPGTQFICSLVLSLYYICRFMEPWAIVLLGGVLPFGSIFIEVYAS